jgi:hypothetical protein
LLYVINLYIPDFRLLRYTPRLKNSLTHLCVQSNCWLIKRVTPLPLVEYSYSVNIFFFRLMILYCLGMFYLQFILHYQDIFISLMISNDLWILGYSSFALSPYNVKAFLSFMHLTWSQIVLLLLQDLFYLFILHCRYIFCFLILEYNTDLWYVFCISLKGGFVCYVAVETLNSEFHFKMKGRVLKAEGYPLWIIWLLTVSNSQNVWHLHHLGDNINWNTNLVYQTWYNITFPLPFLITEVFLMVQLLQLWILQSLRLGFESSSWVYGPTLWMN